METNNENQFPEVEDFMEEEEEDECDLEDHSDEAEDCQIENQVVNSESSSFVFANVKENSVQTNSIKFKCPQLISREPKSSLFKAKLCDNLMNYLFDFLNYDDLKRISSLNVCLHNALVTKYNDWTALMKEKSKKYNFFFNELEDAIDDSIQTTIQTKRLFLQKTNSAVKESHFISLSDYGVSYHVTSFNYNWAWKNEEQYWEVKQYKNSLNNLPTPHLKTVCYLDTCFQFENVVPGLYKLMLRQVCYRLQKECLMLNVLVNDVQKFSMKFPTNEMIKRKSKNKTVDQLDTHFVCYCLIEDKDKQIGQNGATVTIKFAHRDLWWKDGWSIDGGELIAV